ncbi:MAG: hypothetical protein PHN80_14160 [Hespellia sp.]|nr:hypothetical protein [Hespellia sp.]
MNKKILIWIMGLVMLAGTFRPVDAEAAGTVTLGTKDNEVLTYDVRGEVPETKEMVLVVTNNTGADVTNVRVTPTLKENTDGWPFEINEQDYTQNIATLADGASDELTYSFTARGDVEKNYYKLEFLLSYDGAEETVKNIFVKMTLKQSTPEVKPEPAPEPTPEPEAKPDPEVPEENSDGGMVFSDTGVANGTVTSSGGNTDPASVPRVIVTGFDTEPAEVRAGTNFKLIVHVKNTSTKTAVSNMLFDVQAPSSGTEAAAEAPAFLPVSGSSSIFLDKIGTEEVKDISIDMNARADLVQKPYSINLSMKYEDKDAAQYEGASSLAVPVKQPARFEFSKLEISPESIAIGEEANISCSLYNTGRIKLYNVKVKFTGDGIDESEVFVGNVDSGGTGAIDGMITASKEMSPDQKCKMTVSYEDDAGNVSTTEQEFSVGITPAAAAMETAPVEAEPQKSVPIIPIVIGIVLVIAIIIVLVVRRRKKKQTGEEEDLVDELNRLTEDE